MVTKKLSIIIHCINDNTLNKMLCKDYTKCYKLILVFFSDFQGRPASPTYGVYRHTLGKKRRANISFLLKIRHLRIDCFI